MAKSKKGAEMTVGTIVIIVLALIVLVVLVVGFTSGWGNLWTRITAFFGGANVDSVVQACQVACTTEAKNDYCLRERDVKFEDKTKNGKYNCKAIEEISIGLRVCDKFGDCVAIKKIETCDELGGYWSEDQCIGTDFTKEAKDPKIGKPYCCEKS